MSYHQNKGQNRNKKTDIHGEALTAANDSKKHKLYLTTLGADTIQGMTAIIQSPIRLSAL